jgi:hypothetical protein
MLEYFMLETTSRFALPLLASGQAQKEITHNEALVALDALLHGALESRTLATPPENPVPGSLWLLPSTPALSGEWAGHAGQLALATQGGWRFVVPQVGMLLWNKQENVFGYRNAYGWVWGDWSVAQLVIGGERVVGPRQPRVAEPSGGSVIDTQARASIAGILTLLRAHGLMA